ncbi:hypothetical protein DN069_36910 [Streptacidiphilus pinicola]|uniref:Uncharacterized protein n=1 Tax=Streptacidiphilus pinicola TaxID=2219663 RepID=A0A2X0JZN0_9ACTN|nr:hypothetical protein [Streptacidiphilus pinicola]RAG80679.1 hypothetical protein DN069_36910 [Streptacidiphilus pinicola]
MKIELEYHPPTPGMKPPLLARPFADVDYVPPQQEDYQDVVDELVRLSVKLLAHLPDPSLGPDERLERIARVVPTSQLQSANRRSARNKLVALRRRLDELVPGELPAEEKLDLLIARVNELVPGDRPFIAKLETMGDFRATDIGLSPHHWR